MNTPFSAALRLFTFAAISFISVSLVWFAAKTHIDAQQTEALLRQFRDIAPNINIDSTLLASAAPINIDGISSEYYTASDGSTFYRTHTNKGYNGNITLLIGVAADHKTLLGVRVLEHKETPGLGDKIEARISPWILGFTGKSLDNTRFAVKKDGGDFDSFTGATITPRAVANQVGIVLHAIENAPLQPDISHSNNKQP
ncbi:MAG: RnfABCDGE type electron transport complex subunit G [Cardiobacteriaceae bacterium]|nr:RnfABCDGE type electron transport complex subunit G [Cardiobacteriaceae bacterium]